MRRSGSRANAAIVSLLDAVVLRPLPYTEPERLVLVWKRRPEEGASGNVVLPADYKDWAARDVVHRDRRRTCLFTAVFKGGTSLQCDIRHHQDHRLLGTKRKREVGT